MAKKEVIGIIKLQVAAGSANPSPPVGPALGQKVLILWIFCNKFNEATKDFEKGMPIPVIINAYADRSFDFVTKTPPVSFLILKKLKIKKGSGTAGKEVIKEVKKSDFSDIAEVKKKIWIYP